MKDTKLGCLFAITFNSFFFCFRLCRLKTLSVGLLLFSSGFFVCIAQERSVRNKTFSVIGVEDGLSAQSTRGFMFDVASSDEALRLAVDWFSSKDDIMSLTSSYKYLATLQIIELDLGIRYYFDYLYSAADFYIGGGLALVSANYKYEFKNILDASKGDFSGSGRGVYQGFGVIRVFDNGLTLGFDYRDSSAQFELKRNSETGSVPLLLPKDNFGLTRTSLTLGYSW